MLGIHSKEQLYWQFVQVEDQKLKLMFICLFVDRYNNCY